MKKVINGILLVVVAGVWIYIVVRLIQGNEIPKVENTTQAAYFTPHKVAKDTFQIVDAYNDPFRVGERPKRVVKAQPISAKPKRNTNNRLSVNGRSTNSVLRTEQLEIQMIKSLRTSCSYNGFVQNLSSSEPLGLFSFNHRLVKKKPKEFLNENYQIKAIFRDSAWIKIKEYEKVVTLLKG